MESILVHPENNEQLVGIKAILKVLKVQFDTNKASALPTHIKDLATKSIMQYEENGKSLSLAEFSEQYFIKK